MIYLNSFPSLFYTDYSDFTARSLSPIGLREAGRPET